MAKTKHHNFIDTIDQVFTDGVNKNLMYLYTEDEQLDGRNIRVFNKNLINFGSCSYLGLETDERLKQGTIDAVQKYGTQFSSSRSYVSSGQYKELEELLTELFGNPVIVAPSTTLAHIAAIPVLVDDGDAIILDQQVHYSVMTAVQLVQNRGVSVEMIRHSRLDKLEEQIILLRQKHRRIWYMLDGVFSMYGDFAPMNDLLKLLNKYEELYLYIDNSHGMSWAGKHGSGYTLSQVTLHPRMILTASLNKAFASAGGVLVATDKEICRRIKTCGGTMIFSGPIQPPMLGAAIASAKIHLSDEIYELQHDLRSKIDYCNQLIAKTNLISPFVNHAPIFFLAMSTLKVGYNITKRLMDEGFYVNLALFPAVAVKNTGLRFTITKHLSFQDIEQLVAAMVYHYPKALEEEGCTENEIRKAFKLPLAAEAPIPNPQSLIPNPQSPISNLRIQHETTIKAIEPKEWNSLLGANGTFDVEGLLFLEKTFADNVKPEDNWDFHYYIIRNEHGKPLLATFFTCCVSKDDIFSSENISKQIEEKRKTAPYYLTSKTLLMGSLLTEGEHLYMDRNDSQWKTVLLLLLKELTQLQEQTDASNILLRDFDATDTELNDLLFNEGFVKIDLPNSNVAEEMTWNTNEEFLQNITSRNRRHIRVDVLKYEDFYDVEIKEQITEEEAKHFYQMYMNVKSNNLGINTFDLPENIVGTMSEHPNWEFIILKLKAEYDTREKKLPVGVIWAYKTPTHYSPMVAGIDYNFNTTHNVYKQSLWQVVKRARQLELNKVYLGLSADTEKRKYGAKQIPKVAYLQAKDNFSMEVMATMSAIGK